MILTVELFQKRILNLSENCNIMLSNSMNPQEQNWQNFCANHLRDWHGVWTKYSPQGEVIESFQSLRSLRLNQEQTVSYQINRYTYPDGKIEEKKWQSNIESRKTKDGLIHPKHPWMRSLYFEEGAAIWVTKEIQVGMIFHKSELFFRHENLRLSVGTVYDENGNLQMFWNFREDSTGFPSQYWSREINLQPEQNLKKDWQSKAVTITSNLEFSSAIPTNLQWPWQENKTFFLPDGISLSCPDRVLIGNPFTIIANWLVTSAHLQQLIVKYDEKGSFSKATLELFHL